MATVEKKAPKATRPAGKKGGAIAKAGAAAGGDAARPLTPAGRRTAIAALGKGAYELFEEIETMLRVHEQSKLSIWWNLGQKFISIGEQWKKEGLATFCEHLDLDHREVRMAMRAARRWKEADILAIVDSARKSGGNITWSHTRLLLALDEKDLEKYLGVIEKERIGYQQLVAMIRADQGKPARGKKGGRKFNIPGTFDGLYMAGLRQTSTFARFVDQMGKKLPPALDKIDEGRFNADLLARVRRMRAECDHVMASVRARGDELTDFERKIEQKLGLEPDDVPAPAANGAAPKAKAATVRKPPSAAKKKD